MEILLVGLVIFWLVSVLTGLGVIKGPIRKWYHDKLGWHDGSGGGLTFFDGASIHATCSQCGKEVMQDSQGNWF